MSETGVLQRLPRALRLELNRRLRAGEPDAVLLEWLDSQAACESVRQVAEKAAALERATRGVRTTDLLATVLAARWAAEIQRVGTDDPEADRRRHLELAREVTALRRGDLEAARLKLERDKFNERLRAERRAARAERKAAKPKKHLTAATLRKIEKELRLF